MISDYGYVFSILLFCNNVFRISFPHVLYSLVHCFFLLHCIAFYFLSCIVLFCCTVHYCLFGFLIFNLLATSSINLSLNLYLIYSSFKFADIFRSVHFSSHALSNSYKYSRIDMFKSGRGYQYFSPSGYSVPRCC